MNDDNMKITEALEAMAKRRENMIAEKQIAGPQGLRGERGLEGKPAKITVKSVRVGASANVTCDLQDEATNTYALNFVLLQPERGIQGEAGSPGKSVVGPAGPPVKLLIGNVTTLDPSSEASAEIRSVGGVCFLDLNIPRGSRGATGADGAPGRSGRDGKDGGDGKSEVGPAGERGPKGDSLTPDQISEVVIDALKNAGFADKAVEKVIRVQMALKAARRSVSARHVSELDTLYRKVGRIMDGDEG